MRTRMPNRIDVYLDDDLRQRIAEDSKRHRRSVSNMAVAIIAEYYAGTVAPAAKKRRGAGQVPVAEIPNNG